MTHIPLKKRVEEAVEKAGDAFWNVIAKEFPEIKTGDFAPDAHMTLEYALKKAVNTWYDSNREKKIEHVEELLEQPHSTIVRNVYAYIADRSIHDDIDAVTLEGMFYDEENVPNEITINKLEEQGIDVEDFNVYLETMGEIA